MTARADDDEDDDDDTVATEVITANDMLHFKLKVRWGNVTGDPQAVNETNFKGSVSVDSSSRISLENTLRFEITLLMLTRSRAHQPTSRRSHGIR